MINTNFEYIALEWLKLRKMAVKYSTYLKYEGIIFKHLIPFFNNYNLSEIDDEAIILFFEIKVKDENLSSSTLKIIRYILKSIFDLGEEKYNLHHVHFKYMKITGKNEKYKILSIEHRDILEMHCMKEHTACSISILFALYGGLRLGEICALQWKDIDLYEGIIHVNKTVERLKNKEDMD